MPQVRTNENQSEVTDGTTISPRANTKAPQLNSVKNSLKNQGHDTLDPNAHEYQTVDAGKRTLGKRGLSEYSGGSRGGAVAPPSLNNFKL